MAAPANRRNLWLSTVSGYGLVAIFAGLALFAQAGGAIAFDRRFYALMGIKVLTNTLTIWALRRDRFVLEAAGLNVTADALAMTGAIYLTGGIVSPLVAIYPIEVTVVALLTNLGVTVLTATCMLGLYAGMAIATWTGVLAFVPPPALWPYTVGKLAAGISNAALVLAVPTFFCALILRSLHGREKTLEARTLEIIDAGRAKSQFMVNVTHELRTPIHGIFGLSELVESGVYGGITDKQREAQQEIRRSARALLRMIDDLLLLARGDAGRLAFEPEDVDVGELVAGLAGVVRQLLGTKELRLDVDVAPELPAVRTDRAKLNQVVLNLLTNAVKFTPEGGRVAIRAARAGADAVAIAVEDNGIGIPEDARARIFEDFWQADGTMERRYGGAGIGLAVVKRLSVLLEAKVDVQSEEGRGSTFTVVLPLRPARPEARAGGALRHQQ